MSHTSGQGGQAERVRVNCGLQPVLSGLARGRREAKAWGHGSSYVPRNGHIPRQAPFLVTAGGLGGGGAGEEGGPWGLRTQPVPWSLQTEAECSSGRGLACP